MDSFAALVASFTAKIQDLKAFTSLRTDAATMQLLQDHLSRVEADLATIEQKLKALRSFAAYESQAMPKVELLVQALERQRAQLEYLGREALQLPQHRHATALGVTPHGRRQVNGGVENVTANLQQLDANRERRKRSEAPRTYVSQAAFNQLSSYMTQRLTLTKVNSAVNEAADMAEANQRLLAAAKGEGKMSAADRRRAHILQMTVAAREGVKGRFWFTEADMRHAKLLKHDKTGKALLTIMRHLGNLQEVRLSSEGETQVVYVLF